MAGILLPPMETELIARVDMAPTEAIKGKRAAKRGWHEGRRTGVRIESSKQGFVAF